jgi:uncharacterized protein (UPF0335 family)
MNIDKRALKGVVDEIEASRARQKGETEFQREALKRAVKNHQLDAKAIRIVLQRRAMGDTKRDEQDYYVHSYEVALGGKKDALEALEKGASIRQAAKAGGISTGAAAALAKGVQESSFVNIDLCTGEVMGTVPDAPGGGGTAATPDGPGTSPNYSDAPPAGDARVVEMGRGTPDAGIGGATDTSWFCRECEGTGVIVYDDGAKIHGGEPCPVCRPCDPGDEPAEWHRADVYQMEEAGDEHEGLGAARACDGETASDAGRQESRKHDALPGRLAGHPEGIAREGRAPDEEIDLTIPARLDRRARA